MPIARLTARQSIPSLPDPFILLDAVGAEGNNETNSKTLYTGSLSGMTKIVTLGQSNEANSFPTPYTPNDPTTVVNLNVNDGAVYYAADPLLGCSTKIVAGNYAGRLADELISFGPSTKVLLAPIGVSGTAVGNWADATTYGSRIVALLNRFTALGITPDAFLWGQGPTDTIAGTTQAEYLALLTMTINVSRDAGYTGPWFIAIQTMAEGVVAPQIQAAQQEIVDHSLGIWAGPDSDTIGVEHRQDGSHFDDVGSAAYAEMWATALQLYGPPFG